ncbi:MAG: PIG-L family deacetylase [Vampirovibrionales bacterium]|nr:PIG-L family deacetylase [Vampirovibrionales bacterium]
MPVAPLYFPPQYAPPQAPISHELGQRPAPPVTRNNLTTLKPQPQAPIQTLQKPYLGFQDLANVAPADVLVVLAHPDDEIFLSGTAAKLAKEGKRVQFVYATNGKAGEDVSGRGFSGDILGVERSFEASRALQKLGVNRPPMILDFMDGETGNFPEALKEQLRAILLHTRPQTVLLFNAENGLTGHPDHKNVSSFVDDVLETVAEGKSARDRADQNKLGDLFNSGGVYQASLSETAFRHFRLFFPEDNPSWQGLQAVYDSTVTLRTPIDPELSKIKALSHQQHASQYRSEDFAQMQRFYQQYPYEEFIRYQIKRQPAPRIQP